MPSVRTIADDLRRTVNEALPRLRALDAAASARAPAPGKWCPREVLGHLVDSASNNHQRFVRARFQEDLIFPGYEQDAWIEAQRYREAPWGELVELWRTFNLHLARVIELVPEEVAARAHPRHNLDRIAFRTLEPDEPATLAYFMDDYVEHLRHHLAALGDPATRGK